MSSLVEKFRNKKVFIGYLVGVLLLSTSVSFAYFTSRTNTSGEGGVAVGTTTVIEADGVNADGLIEFNNVDMYPGHTGIAGIRVTATGTTPMIYNVIFNGTNTFNTELKYTVYKTTTEVDASYTCNKREDRIGVNTYYYEECTGNNIEELGSAVKTGTIHTNEGKTTLLDSEIILGTEEGNIVYYYVVIEYPNLDTSQNDDIGSTISGNITIEEGEEYTNPSISMVGTTTSGSNGWVRSASINTTITTQTGNYEALYCTTTSDSCTPNTSATISNNSFSVSLSSNSSAQRLCVSVTDEYDQVANGCSEAYNVDGQAPTSSTSIASSTSGSNGWYRALSISATGSDSHSGVASIRYCTTTSSSCTPSTTVNGSSTTVTLSSNASAQRVCVQAADAAGNTSSTSCSSVYSVDTTNPTVSISSTSSTQNSISVTVRESDSHSGIYQYRFSSNGGSSYTITSSSSTYTYTFNNLSAGTTYNIRVQAVDRSGRTSSVASRSVSTESANAGETILANYPTQSTRSSFSSTVTGTTTGTIYYEDTSDGRTYYFAGNPTDNWVSFAGFWWRIVRINEDGSVRMIYQGTSANTTGTGTQIGTSTFSINSSTYDNNAYVGYMYTLNQVHGLGTDSGIKGVVDQWYEENLQANYAQYLSTEAGFCGDRTPYIQSGSSGSYTYTSGGGTGTTVTYYGAHTRLSLSNAADPNPTFECLDNSDLYTVASSSQGNNALVYPIGLITADEVAYAGGVYNMNNTRYYLYTGQEYWIMSPAYLNMYGNAYVFYVRSNGPLNAASVHLTYGVRPVINLSPNVTISGSGTTSDPYTVS